MVRQHNERIERGKNNQIAGTGTSQCPIIQEQQDAGKRQVVHKSKKPEMDETMHGQFRVSVTLLVSDQRDRDGDGMYSTIQDCLIAAIGRLAKMDRLALRKLAKSEERRRGV
jgi:hypothetical protein